MPRDAEDQRARGLLLRVSLHSLRLVLLYMPIRPASDNYIDELLRHHNHFLDLLPFDESANVLVGQGQLSQGSVINIGPDSFPRAEFAVDLDWNFHLVAFG